MIVTNKCMSIGPKLECKKGFNQANVTIQYVLTRDDTEWMHAKWKCEFLTPHMA